MAKGRIVTDSVRALIARTKGKHEKWTAKEVRKEVEKLLRQQDETLPKGWPGLSVVQRTLADMKHKSETPSPLDGPWHLGALDTYPIAHAAIPALLEVCKLRITMAYQRPSNRQFWENRYKQAMADAGKAAADAPYLTLRDTSKVLTIREAKWVARLCAVVQDTEKLSAWAADYADTERLYESIGRPFFSGFMDAELMGFYVLWGTLLDQMKGTGDEGVAADFLAFRAGARFAENAEGPLDGLRGRPVVDVSTLLPKPAAPKKKRKGGK